MLLIQTGVLVFNFILIGHAGEQEVQKESFFCPAECDTPLRGANGGHEWFWEPDGEIHVKSVQELVAEYEITVGHNCNLMLGLNPNQQGLIDDIDMTRYQQFGYMLAQYSPSNSIANTSGSGEVYQVSIPDGLWVDRTITQEDQSQGESVTLYVVEAQVGGLWQIVAQGKAIGHKKIDSFPAVQATAMKLTILESFYSPVILNFSAYFIGS